MTSIKKPASLIILTALLLASGIMFASHSAVQAKNLPQAALAESSLTAIPPRLGEDLSLKAKPGEKIQTSVRVRNGSSETVTVQSLAQDFIVEQNGETPIAVDNQTSNRWSLASWVLLTPSVQAVQPGQIATVNVIITVPANALPGGHYAMITHQPNSSSDTNPKFNLTQNSAAALQQRVGTLLYLTVEGPINEAAFIRELTFPQFSEFGPVPFSLKIDNQSDIHLRPQIGIEIYNLWGKKIDTLELESKNVFPFIEREFSGEWGRIWGFGHYTAKAVMSYGTTGQLAIATTGFWLLPITIVLAIVITILVLIAIVILIRRHVAYRHDDQRQQIEILESKLHQMEQDKLKKFEP